MSLENEFRSTALCVRKLCDQLDAIYVQIPKPHCCQNMDCSWLRYYVAMATCDFHGFQWSVLYSTSRLGSNFDEIVHFLQKCEISHIGHLLCTFSEFEEAHVF